MNEENFLAKPSGITLLQHTNDVMSEASDICQRLDATCSKYLSIVGKNLQKRLEKAAQIHDFGKHNRVWQGACRKDYQDFLDWKAKNPDGNFKQYSLEVGQHAGQNIRKCGVRHEFRSLLMGEKIKLPISLQAAIAAHHSKLGYAYADRWTSEGFKNFFNMFAREANEVIESEDFSACALKSYEFNGVRGLLELSDHRASAKEDEESVYPISKFDYKFPFTEKRGVQKLMEEHWKDDILLVRAPTGAGKTDASLLWASKQIENKRAERLIIAMPTKFTSNALAVNISESLSNTGLYHSSAWSNAVANKDRDSAIQQLQNARLLLTPITVCTIDHLLMSLTLTREDHHLIDFNLANSCVVVDEADFYDEFTMANIMFLLRVLREWKVPVLMMSASLPDSLLPVINSKTGYDIKQIYQDTTDIQRYRFKIEDKRVYQEFDDIKDLIDLCIEQGNGIIYMNTIDKAIQCYQYVRQRINQVGRHVNIFLYHSHFTEPDKVAKEKQLIDALGSEAWAENKANGIAILTQIGEMSVNISADIMLSDLCPIDRLIQRAGRLCRFDKNKVGSLYLLLPYKDNVIYPAPYGEYDLKEKKWKTNEYFMSTEKLLDVDKYNVSKLTELLNTVYDKQKNFSIKAIDNSKILESSFIYNWLINPVENTNEEQEDTMMWKSRDISPQGTVFVEKPSKNIMSWREFLLYKMESGIDLPVYQLEKARKLHRIDLTEVRLLDKYSDNDNRININVVREGFYNKEIGLDILKPSNDDNFL